jgi:hypothetical protein
LQVSYILNHQKLASCFCVATWLNLFSTKFWFSFVSVCVMHGIWLIVSVGFFCSVWVVISCFCRSFVQVGNIVCSFFGLKKLSQKNWWFCE